MQSYFRDSALVVECLVDYSEFRAYLAPKSPISYVKSTNESMGSDSIDSLIRRYLTVLQNQNQSSLTPSISFYQLSELRVDYVTPHWRQQIPRSYQ